MRLSRRSGYEGTHSFLSPSYYHWINYSTDKLHTRWRAVQAALAGIEDHRYAAEAIERGIFQDESTMLGAYINDCIRFRMQSEVVLFYSRNCFGTVDAIAFRYKKLRISDLKTGVSPTSVHQLEVYAALFCLEYDVDPYDIKIELRIYQGDEIREYVGDPSVVVYIMDKIIEFDQEIESLREEEVDASD
jgi:hypothetical protein